MRRQHILWLGWIGLLVVVLLAVGLLLRHKGIEGELTALKNRRKAVEADNQNTKDELKKDLQRYVKVLRRFPWLLESGSGTAFLSRLSDVAADHLVEIRGVGPLERRKIGHIEKIGRRVKVSGSFSDILRVVENVEQNWGIIEGLRVEPPDQKGKNNGSENLQAQFSLVTVELSTSGRQRMRSLLASVPASKEANEERSHDAGCYRDREKVFLHGTGTLDRDGHRDWPASCEARSTSGAYATAGRPDGCEFT